MPAPRRKPQHRARYRTLQALLRPWRDKAKLSQRELAEMLGHQHPFCHKAETGARRLDPCEWADWAKACGIPPDVAFRVLFPK